MRLSPTIFNLYLAAITLLATLVQKMAFRLVTALMAACLTSRDLRPNQKPEHPTFFICNMLTMQHILHQPRYPFKGTLTSQTTSILQEG